MLILVACTAFSQCDTIDAYVEVGVTTSEYYSAAIAVCYLNGGYGSALIAITHDIAEGESGGGPVVYSSSWETSGGEAQDTTNWFGDSGDCFYTTGHFWIGDFDFNPTYYDGAAEACACIGGGGSGGDGDLKDEPGTPIIIDIDGDGYLLTNVAKGIRYDLDGDGQVEPIAWTKSGRDGFLWIDSNLNGSVDNGSELFGNSAHRHGFEKLRLFDEPSRGGNADGRIDDTDTIWSSLMIWQDKNHNGVSEYEEISRLAGSRFRALGLAYQTVGRRDLFGNLFRYQGRIYITGSPYAELLYDVVFATAE